MLAASGAMEILVTWWPEGLAGLALVLAAIPAVIFLGNLRLYRPPPNPHSPDPHSPDPPQVSVLIPARNEEQSIGPAVEAVLASRGVDFEVVVLDDQSTDRTAEIVAQLAEADARVRLLRSEPLPPGWCGKQRACYVLSQQAKKELMVFLDADVRLQPDGLARLVAFQQTSKAELVSGVPHQETGTWLEKLVIPLIHFLLLGFLPMGRMRASPFPGYGAGCGQLFLARRSGYETFGGHAAIKTSLHDGITLPRAFRKAGLMTDLCDATDVATCRMYRSASQVWWGLFKNAGEGLANPGLIFPASILLSGGQVLPVVLLSVAWWRGTAEFWALSLLATIVSFLPRFTAAIRFRQNWLGVILHPVSILLLLGIQWQSLLWSLLGLPNTWKGRSYAPTGQTT